MFRSAQMILRQSIGSPPSIHRKSANRFTLTEGPLALKIQCRVFSGTIPRKVEVLSWP